MHELDPVFTTVADYFSILSEPTRLKIMHSVCHGEKAIPCSPGIAEPALMIGIMEKEREGLGIRTGDHTQAMDEGMMGAWHRQQHVKTLHSEKVG